MPANLTPQYQKAEEEFRRTQSPEERLVCLEKMLQLIPKHKGTEKLQADLKTKLKEARSEAESEKQVAKKGPSYRFPRQGAGTVVLLGPPNSGRSRILAELTNAEPEVADYPYTTREAAPAMMSWEDVSVQLIDTPPVTDSHLEPYLINIVRAADGVLLCFDGSSDDAPIETSEVIRQFTERKTVLSDSTGFVEEDFSKIRLRTLLVVTRGADPDTSLRLELFREQVGRDFDTLVVDLDREEDREQLRRRIFELLRVIRVYTKKPGKPAEYVDPYTIPLGGTAEDVAARVHRDLAESLTHARVWGQGVTDGQTVGRDHVLKDRDMVELHG